MNEAGALYWYLRLFGLEDCVHAGEDDPDWLADLERFEIPKASARLDGIGEILGPEVMGRARAKAEWEFYQLLGPEGWTKYTGREAPPDPATITNFAAVIEEVVSRSKAREERNRARLAAVRAGAAEEK